MMTAHNQNEPAKSYSSQIGTIDIDVLNQMLKKEEEEDLEFALIDRRALRRAPVKTPITQVLLNRFE